MSKAVVHVLLIEDDASRAEAVCSTLSQAALNVAVDCIDQWPDARHLLDLGDYDAILAAVNLADHRGLEAVRRIRDQAPHVPLVLLTDQVDEHAARQCGAVDYLLKDRITPELLERVIRRALRRRRAAGMRRQLAGLRASEQLLERSNRRLARLNRTAHHAVDDLSHDFRTPLTVITEYVSLLRDGVVGPIDEQQGRMLDVIGDRADDLNNMVDDMLDLSKLQAGVLSVFRKRCSVAAIVGHVRPTLERKAGLRKVRLTVALDDDLPEVFCDPDKVHRVIVNLAVNAVKASGDPGEVRLWARCNLDDSQVTIGVTDNGPGIEDKRLAELTQRFGRHDAKSGDVGKGFGLGLSIAKRLTELNLGQLGVESRSYQGCTFFFTMPLAHPEAVVRRYVDWLVGRRRSTVVSVATATIDESTPEHTADEVNALLNYALRPDDLLFRVAPHQWLLVVPLRRESTDMFIDRVARLHDDTNRNRAHGLLPEISIHVESSCRLDAARTEILEHFQTLTDPLTAG